MMMTMMMMQWCCCRKSLLLFTGLVFILRCDTVNAERAQGCFGTTLNLRCSDTKVIQISSVLLGDTWCSGSSCCIKDDSCTASPNDDHVKSVKRRCNGQRSCSVPVIKGSIPCGFISNSNNDFERIIYDCVEAQDSPTTNSKTGSSAHDIDQKHDGSSTRPPNGSESNDQKSTTITVAATVALCCIVLIAIIIVIICILRRGKKSQQSKSSYAVEMSDADAGNRGDGNTNSNTNHNQNSAICPIYVNDVSQENKTSTEPQDYEVSANEATSDLTYSLEGSCENDTVYSEVIAKEPKYETPKKVVDVESKKPAKSVSPEANTYEGACDWKRDLYGASPAKPVHGKETAKSGPDAYSKVDKPVAKSGNVAVSSKEASEHKTTVSSSSDFTPSPVYEPMSPEGIYANEPAAPIRAMSTATSRGGSETDNIYCDMQSPTPIVQNDEQTVVENELYSH